MTESPNADRSGRRGSHGPGAPGRASALRANHGCRCCRACCGDPRAARRPAASVYRSAQELLESASLDGVLIAAPTDQHPGLVETFAAAGIPMLCEKPVGVRPEDAERATRAAADAGVLLQVGYWRRFVPELRELRDRSPPASSARSPCSPACSGTLGFPRRSSVPTRGNRGRHGRARVRPGSLAAGRRVRVDRGSAGGPSTQPRPAADPDSAVLLATTSTGAAVTISLGRQFPYSDPAGSRSGARADTSASRSCGTRTVRRSFGAPCVCRPRRSRGRFGVGRARARRRRTRSPRRWSRRGGRGPG